MSSRQLCIQRIIKVVYKGSNYNSGYKGSNYNISVKYQYNKGCQKRFKQ